MNYLPSFAFLLFLATAMTSSIGCQAQTASNDFGRRARKIESENSELGRHEKNTQQKTRNCNLRWWLFLVHRGRVFGAKRR
jgi:hypothetical protein